MYYIWDTCTKTRVPDYKTGKKKKKKKGIPPIYLHAMLMYVLLQLWYSIYSLSLLFFDILTHVTAGCRVIMQASSYEYIHIKYDTDRVGIQYTYSSSCSSSTLRLTSCDGKCRVQIGWWSLATLYITILLHKGTVLLSFTEHTSSFEVFYSLSIYAIHYLFVFVFFSLFSSLPETCLCVLPSLQETYLLF